MINGIDNYNEVASLKVAWLDENLELGNWAEVALDCPEMTNVEPVETGVDSTSPDLLVICVVATCIIVVYKKYLPY